MDNLIKLVKSFSPFYFITEENAKQFSREFRSCSVEKPTVPELIKFLLCVREEFLKKPVAHKDDKTDGIHNLDSMFTYIRHSVQGY